MYKIDKIHCTRLVKLSIDKIHCTMYNKTIAKGNTPSSPGQSGRTNREREARAGQDIRDTGM